MREQESEVLRERKRDLVPGTPLGTPTFVAELRHLSSLSLPSRPISTEQDPIWSIQDLNQDFCEIPASEVVVRSIVSHQLKFHCYAVSYK